MNLNMYDHPKTGDYKSNCKQKKNYKMANQNRKKNPYSRVSMSLMMMPNQSVPRFEYNSFSMCKVCDFIDWLVVTNKILQLYGWACRSSIN